MIEQDPAQGQDAPEQGPSSDRERLAEVYRFAQGQQDANAPKKETPVQSFWDRVKHGVAGKSRPREIGKAIARGVVGAGNSMVQTVAEIGAGIADVVNLGGTEAEQDARKEKAKNARAISEETVERTFGARSDDPIAALTESLTQAAVSFVALRRIPGLKNPIAAGAAVDAVGFNPYEESLSELAAQHGEKVPVFGKIAKVLGEAGSVDADDSFLEARLKRVVEGGIVGAVFSGAVETAKLSRKLTKAKAAGDTKAVAEIEAKLDEIADGTDVPEGSRVARQPNDDGTWRVEELDDVAFEVQEALESGKLDEGIARLEASLNEGELDVPFKAEGNFVLELDGVRLEAPPSSSVPEEGLTEGTFTISLPDGKEIQLTGVKNEEGVFQVSWIGEKSDDLNLEDIPLLADASKGVNREFVGSVGARNLKAVGQLIRQQTGAHSIEGFRVSGSRPNRKALRDLPNPEGVQQVTKGSPRFTRTEAEVQARTMDFALRQADAPKGAHFSDADVKLHFETADRIKNAQTLDEALDIVGSEDHFNLGAIASGDDFNAQMRALVARYSPSFDAARKRPVVAQNTTIQAAASVARTLGIEDWALKLAKAPDKLALSVETVLKASAVKQVGERVAEIAGLFRARPHDPAVLAESRRLLNVWHALSLEAFEHNSELGRALNILGRMKDQAAAVRFKKGSLGTGLPAKEADLDAALAKGGYADDMTPEQVQMTLDLFARSGGEPRNLDAVVKALRAAEEGAAEVQAGRSTHDKVASWVNTIYMNAMLSGPRTIQTVFANGLAINAFEATSRMLAGTATLNKGLIQEGAAYWYAMFRYARENVRGMGKSFMSGSSTLEGTPPIYLRTGVSSLPVTVPGRIIGTVDELTRATAYRADEYAKAFRNARESNMSWADAAKNAEDAVRFSVDEQTGLAKNPLALEQAGVMTFNNPLDPNTFMGGMANVIGNTRYGKLFVPFMTSATNIFQYAWQHAPGLNMLNKKWRDTLLGKEGPEEAAKIWTRTAMASSMWFYAYSLFAQDKITGNGPSDPTLRKAWLANHQPYSVKKGDTWVSYRRMEPFASWLGHAADLSEATHEADSDGDAHSLTTAFVSATIQQTYNKTFMTNVAELLSAIESQDDDSDSWARYGRSLGSGFMPQAVAAINDDPYLRESRTLLDTWRAKTPGLSESLPPKFNLVGEPVMKQGSMWNRNASIFTTKQAGPAVLEDALLENDIALKPFPPKFAKGQIDLLDPRWVKGDKPLPYVRFMEIVRENDMRGKMEAYVKSEEYKNDSGGTPNFPGGQRKMELLAIKDRVEEKALKQLSKEYPELGTAMKGAQYKVPTAARYKGADAEAAAREKYGVPVPK